MNIAIMGATSHIAKGLTVRFIEQGTAHVHLYSRSLQSVRNHLDSIGIRDTSRISLCDDYGLFTDSDYDVIINCIGVETRTSDTTDFTRYFSVTEEFDNLALSYLQFRRPQALYISFSSGAVYGGGFSSPATDSTTNCIPVNHMQPEHFYGIARMNAEAKHRAHSHLNIVDLRVFSYFSRYITLTDGYFITDLLEAVLHRKTLITDSSNIVRDYLHPDDLFTMIAKCIAAGPMNRPLDVFSAAPAAKSEILDYFSATYGLKYEMRQSSGNPSTTGAKSNYFSNWDQASLVGYVPRYGSLDTLKSESQHLLKGKTTMKGVFP